MLLYPADATSNLSVHVTYPADHLLQLPPAPLPQVLSPPVSDFTFARPFNIDPDLYNDVLNFQVPLTITVAYAILATYFSNRNSQKGNKPWAVSKTRVFYVFVVLHNFFLAVYSTWTFLGMINTAKRSWPGWNGENGIVGVVDAMCKINGPRGLGSATTYDASTGTWGVKDRTIKLLGGFPDNTDVGRIWNEGLAFYGWLFYISKFYEVVDTMVVIAKGKSSSFLQTYHHAGAMMSMWAGIRYMSPPIWMFVLVNSGIHSLMYTYYTLYALSIRVPISVKRTITTLQIGQLLWGVSYAMSHLFIAYTVPVDTPYLFTHSLSSALPALTSTVSSAVASATVPAGIGNLLKKIVLRAAGEEGLAENVRNNVGETFGIDAIKAMEVEKAQEEIRYKLEYPMVNCLDTSGQVFAILLNIMYLAPLTFLFFRFFIRSYIKRTAPSKSQSSLAHNLEKSSEDAFKGVERKISESVMAAEKNDETAIPPDFSAKFEHLKANVKDVAERSYEVASDKVEIVREWIEERTEHIETKESSIEDEIKQEVNQTDEPESSSLKDEVIKREEVNGTEEPKDASAEADDDVEVEPQPEVDHHHNHRPESESESEPPLAAEEDPVHHDHADDHDHDHEADGLNESGYEMNESAYEANFDEVKNEAEEKAEAELQPNGGTWDAASG